MIVVDNNGNLFDDRRQGDRRKKNKKVKVERRSGDRRTINENKKHEE